MGFVELIRIAARNLRRRKARTAWTAAGVTLGTVCMILAGAFAISGKLHFNKALRSNPTWMDVEVSLSSDKGVSDMKMTDADILEFLEIEGTKNATPILRLPVYLLAGEYEAGSLDLIAVEPGFYDFVLKGGASFDSDSATPQIVMGYAVQSRFINEKGPGNKESTDEGVGETINKAKAELSLPFDYKTQTIRLYLGSKDSVLNGTGEIPKSKRYNAIITGILYETQDEMNNSSFISLNAAKRIIKENLKLAESLGMKLGEYEAVRIRAADIEDVPQIVKTIKDMGFQAQAKGEIVENAQKEQERQQRQFLLIGLITWFVSAISIANMIQTSILEHRHEFGDMKAIGLPLTKIRQMFLMEAAMTGLIGGIAGAVVSYAAVFFADESTGRIQIFGMYLSEGAQLVIPFWLPITCLTVTAFIGMAAGVYPAYKSMKMSPMDL